MNQPQNEHETIFPPFTPQKVAKTQKQYIIPIYQRLFEWEKEQIEQLLDDLYTSYKKGLNKPYYIGILTAIKEKEDNKYALVDGQQRFVVLTLIGCVLRKYYEEWENFLKNGNIRIEFKARKEDQKYLEYLVCPIKKTDKIQENYKMKKGITCIQNWIKTKFKFCSDCITKSCQFSDLYHYSKYIFEQTAFFISLLPDNYQKDSRKLNQYFERLNSSGKNLEQHEIQKVKCLKGLTEELNNRKTDLSQETATFIWNIVSQMNKPIIRNKNEENNEGTYNRYINCINNIEEALKQLNDYHVLETTEQKDTQNNDISINNIEKALKHLNDYHVLETTEQKDTQNNDISIKDIKESKQKPQKTYSDGSYNGCHSMLTFSEFLLQVLWLSIDEETQKKQIVTDFFDVKNLLTTYEKITSNYQKWSWNTFFHNLLLYRVIYDLYAIRISDAGEYNNNDSEDNEDYYNLDYVTDTDKRKLVQFQYMLWTVSSSQSYYLWLAPYINYIHEHKNKKLNSEQLLDFLKTNDNKNHPFDKNKLNYQDRPLYWLRRLDYYLWEANEDNEKDKVISAFRFRKGGLSIEHVHPQNQTNQVDEWEKEDIHSFGNLALISSSFNSTQGNDSVKVKFARIADRAQKENIESIKLYYIYKECEHNVDNWNQAKMKKHEGKMIEILNQPFNSK